MQGGGENSPAQHFVKETLHPIDIHQLILQSPQTPTKNSTVQSLLGGASQLYLYVNFTYSTVQFKWVGL